MSKIHLFKIVLFFITLTLSACGKKSLSKSAKILLFSFEDETRSSVDFYDNRGKKSHRAVSEYDAGDGSGTVDVGLTSQVKKNRPESNDTNIYLDDIIFKVYKKPNNSMTLVGRKLFTRNKITNQFFKFDNLKSMAQIGKCRSELRHMSYDIEDDGKLNQSTNKDACFSEAAAKVLNCNGKWKMKETTFIRLDDWYGDNFEDALLSFLNSCKAMSTVGAKSKTINIGTKDQWAELCKIAEQYYSMNLSRSFFERYFSPFLVSDDNKQKPSNGLFTSYFLWEIKVSREKTSKYWYPVLSMDEECAKSRLCKSRAEINQDPLGNKSYAIVWTDNVFDLYNMQVQGSGVGTFEDGSTVTLGYAGKNDMPFRSYSEYIKRDKKTQEECSEYRDIFECLRNNHDLAIKVTNYCESYVFFRELEDNDIKGSQGVSLTPSRSIAIDPMYVPYGLPVWIETSLPIKDEKSSDEVFLDFNRLWVAQDTGSAIKGANRADLYLGHGLKASLVAKRMKFDGQFYVLIPNNMISSVKGCKLSHGKHSH